MTKVTNLKTTTDTEDVDMVKIEVYVDERTFKKAINEVLQVLPGAAVYSSKCART